MSDSLDRVVSQRDYPRKIAIFMVGDLQLFLMGIEHAPFMVNRVSHLKFLLFLFKGVRLHDCILYKLLGLLNDHGAFPLIKGGVNRHQMVYFLGRIHVKFEILVLGQVERLSAAPDLVRVCDL